MARTFRRTPLAAAALVVGSLALAGCSVVNPITTQGPYAPSDGVRVEVADRVSVENLMVLTTGEGEVGHVLGAVVNRSEQDVEVTLALGEGGSTIPVGVAAGETVNLTDAGISLAEVAVAPGAMLDSLIGATGSGDVAVAVPVLDGTIPPYDEYLAGA
ncbi:MAG: hypothetical protein ACYC1Z_10030 [Georgenia sp.]